MKLGSHHSAETRAQMSKMRRGRQPSEKQAAALEILHAAHLGTRHLAETRYRMSVAALGNKRSLGCKRSPETRARLSVNQRGASNSNWRGGRGTDRHREIGCVRYKEWRKAIFVRDDFRCSVCGERSGKLHAHHLFAWVKYPKLRYEVANGITAHIDCHRKFWHGASIKLAG